MFLRSGKRRRPENTASLDEGLALLNERLGSSPGASRKKNKASAARLRVRPTAHVARSIYYAPDMDGQAEPGEVVWVTVPSSPPSERSLLVVGREQRDIMGLLISPSSDHAEDSQWLEIGCGDWDSTGRPCWVRMDKILLFSETDAHRRGSIIPQRRFDRVANRLRDNFNWI